MNVANTAFHRDGEPLQACAAVEQRRVRSAGILSRREVGWCRTNGVAIAFDPLQSGWVPASCRDDLTRCELPRESLGFRPWRAEDAPLLARMLSAEGLWRFLPEPCPGPVDTAAAAQLIELAREPHHHVAAVTLGNRPIGQARLLFTGTAEAEISYWLGEDHWGKGYGSRIVSDFTELCLGKHPEIARLFARVHKENHASRRVLEKAGYCRGARDGDWIILERHRDA